MECQKPFILIHVFADYIFQQWVQPGDTVNPLIHELILWKKSVWYSTTKKISWTFLAFSVDVPLSEDCCVLRLHFSVCNETLLLKSSSCLIQELSKITMPVIFNEPLSFLQRLTEYMEHTYLIHQANSSADSIERMKVDMSCVDDWKRQTV